jgi:hypothetical protein
MAFDRQNADAVSRSESMRVGQRLKGVDRVRLDFETDGTMVGIRHAREV